MNKLLLCLSFILFTANLPAQRLPSSCEAPDSIISLYSEDAHRLALRKIYRQELPEKAEIIIPRSHTDTVLRALLAVYNVLNMPARDTVVLLYQVHSFPDYLLNYMQVVANSNQDWMQQLKRGSIPTGNNTVDSIMDNYYWHMTEYQDYSGYFSWDVVVFQSSRYYNIPPFAQLFTPIPGFQSIEPLMLAGDGANITDEIYVDHVELTYSIGWGDCPSGCISSRYWKFRVYYDCSVEFVESYGDALPSSIGQVTLSALRAYPNPFHDRLWIEGAPSYFDYNIVNLLGQHQISGSTHDGCITGLSVLPQGIYWVTIRSGSKMAVLRIMRQ